MSKPSFNECICRLQLTYFSGPEYQKNKDFWYIIDRLDNNDLLKWSERLTKTKQLQGYDFVRTCNILFEYKKSGWSLKQKRSCAMQVIKHWDVLSYKYEL